MKRAAAIGLLAALTGLGCLQILGDDYVLPCADETDCLECFKCADNGPCADLLAECVTSPSCDDYGDCISACSGASCEDGCEAAHPGGRESWDALFDCGYELCEHAC